MFKTGDILGVESTIAGIIHFAIVYHDKGCPMIAHISYQTNMPETMKLADFLMQRSIKKVIHNGNPDINDEVIIENINRLKSEGRLYDVLNFNCEDFVRDVCSCDFYINQKRRIFALAVLVSIILILIFFK